MVKRNSPEKGHPVIKAFLSSNAHSLAHTHSLTHSLTLTRSHSLVHTHSFTLTLTHSHSHIHSSFLYLFERLIKKCFDTMQATMASTQKLTDGRKRIYKSKDVPTVDASDIPEAS